MDYEGEFRRTLARLRDENRYRDLRVSGAASFVHNDYLGLSKHPEILEAGRKAVAEWGAGSRGSRLLGGHSPLFERVEDAIAGFFNAPSALIFSSGYLANLAAIRAVAPFVDGVVSDEKNHASIIDAIALSKLPKTILPHGEWSRLADSSYTRPLVVTESLFSMDGDLVDWRAVDEAARAKKAYLIVDEAHAAGMFYERGMGVSDGNVDWERTAMTVTFGKAFGVAGAAVLGSHALKELMINTARSFIYTTAPSPVVVAMIEASLDVVKRESWRREKAWKLASHVREILKSNPKTKAHLLSENGVWDSRSPVVAFLIPGDVNALRFCQSMRESGFEIRAIRYPTVPKGSERLRISVGLENGHDVTESMARKLVERWTAFLLQA